MQSRLFRPRGRLLALVCVCLSAIVLTIGPRHGVAGASEPKRGGVLTITFLADVPTLDPAFGYDSESWPAQLSVFSGLMDYAPHSTDLVPSLAAAMPAITNGGKTYTFKIRKGVYFTNGQGLTAADFKYSFERVANPKDASPYQTWWTYVAGYNANHFTGLSGIKVLDSYTLQITLNSPFSAFLNVLAMPGSFVVPRSVASKYPIKNGASDFSNHAVGTGPFMVQHWVHGQQLVLVRNPHYWKPGLPYLDGVTFLFGLKPEVALLRLKQGSVDLLGDGLPPSEYVNTVHDPYWGHYIVRAPLGSTNWLAMNVQMAPFQNVLVRKAVQMAVNKMAILRVINGRGTVATGIFPPSLKPYYTSGVRGYAYDPTTAKQLLAKAGYPNGFSTTLYSLNSDPSPEIAAVIQQSLAQIGVTVRLQNVAFGEFTGAIFKPKTAAMSQAWWQWDFPDPSDFVDALFTCAARGGWNVNWFCDAGIDRLANQARGEQNVATRIALYRQIEQKVMDTAIWVPLYNATEVDVHSPALHGYYIHPVWAQGNVTGVFEQYWKE
jgi:ABC-type transport system substrate-binding protein